MAEEVIDFSKLSLEARCTHKNFKARISAYEELINIFKRIDDEKSPEWSKYTYLMKNIPVDVHAAAQEKGLEATLIFVENSNQAPSLVGELVSGVVNKCLTAARPRVKELGIAIILTSIEIERCETVQEQLMKGLEHKNPKVVASTLAVFTESVHVFGAKIFKVKLLSKKLVALLEDRDKSIRDEAKKFTVELWHWIGPPFRQELNSLKPALLGEIEAEYTKVSASKPEPTRLLRSQQVKQAKREAKEAEAETDEEGVGVVEEVEVDEFQKPEEILSKIPKDFYTKIEDKKWQERKEALESIEALTVFPSLENGDYSELVRALRRVVAKDSNIPCIAVAIKCLGGLANGLKKKFSPYAQSVLSVMMEKFKEKKATVLNPLKETADIVFGCTTLEAIAEDVITNLQNKNPTIKSEVALFLSRAFSKTPNKVFQDKKFIKPFITTLVGILNDSDPNVRDSAAEALGVSYKAMGERAISPLLADVDPKHLAKIKDFAEKAVVLAVMKVKEKPKSAPAPEIGETKEAKKPTSIPSDKAPVKKKPVVKKAPVKPATATGASSSASSSELNLAPPVANPNARVDLLSKLEEGFLDKLTAKDWKVREDALDKLAKVVSSNPKITPYLGDLVRVLCQRLNDSNRSLASTAFLILQNLANVLGPHCKQHLRAFLPGILSGLSETRINVRANVIACLNSWADNTSVEEFFQGEMIADALKQPNPILRTELYNWLSGRMITMKNPNKDDLATALPMLFSSLEDRNSDVRKSANDCIIGFMTFLGYDKMVLAAGRLKPASKSAVQAALDKARPKLPSKPPAGTSKGKPVSGLRIKMKQEEKVDIVPAENSFGHASYDSPEESKHPLSPKNANQTPSPIYGSAETLIVSPLATRESGDTMKVVNIPDRNNSDGWSGVPKEYQVDFAKIAQKYNKYENNPMPPLDLKDSKIDWINSPVKLPEIMSLRKPATGTSEGNLPSKAAQSLDMLIVQVANPDPKKSLEALVQLEVVIVDPTLSHLMYTRIDQLLLCMTMQMRKLQPTFDTSDKDKLEETLQLLRCICQTIQSVFRQIELPCRATMDALKDLIHTCLMILSDANAPGRIQNFQTIVRYLDVLIVRIVERSDLNQVFRACMRLMTDATSQSHMQKILDLAMKAQWKALKQFGVVADEKPVYDFDIGGYLFEFHLFLKAHPFVSWKERNDVPLKTMKTVMHTIVYRLGPQNVADVLREKDSLKGSEASFYMQKLIDRESMKTGVEDGLSKRNNNN